MSFTEWEGIINFTPISADALDLRWEQYQEFIELTVDSDSMVWNRCKQLSESGHLAAEAMDEAREIFLSDLIEWEASNYLLEDFKPRWLEQLSRTTGSWQYWYGLLNVAFARIATDLSSVLQEIIKNHI